MPDCSKLYHPFLIGDDIYLRGIELADIDGKWFSWFNDKDVTKYMFNGTFPNTREGLIDYYEKTCVNNHNDIVLAIIEKDSNEHVGNIGIHRINYLYRRAELGIVIGEKSIWGKGYGSAACSLITRHCFNRLNLHKIFLRVAAENKGGIRAFEKAGFAVEAVLKDEIISDGRFCDSVYMSMFARDIMKDEWVGTPEVVPVYESVNQL